MVGSRWFKREAFRRGDSAIWIAGSGLGLCLLMIGGMIALILTKGLGFFWPRPIVELTMKDGSVLMGEISGREPIPRRGPEQLPQHRLQLKLGNRDLSDADFKWTLHRTEPEPVPVAEPAAPVRPAAKKAPRPPRKKPSAAATDLDDPLDELDP